jgi:hypothetical protein
MNLKDLASRIAALDWSGTSLQHQLGVAAAVETIMGFGGAAPSNVVALPVRPRTCWTTLCHLDGREWARSSHFGPEGAWGWIVDTVTHEHGCNSDDIHCAESDEYDGDDLVTVDGLPMYRIQHTC